jgi:hypothetical protein
MEPESPIPNSQGFSNDPYPDPNQSHSSYWHLFLEDPFKNCILIYGNAFLEVYILSVSLLKSHYTLVEINWNSKNETKSWFLAPHTNEPRLLISMWNFKLNSNLHYPWKTMHICKLYDYDVSSKS